MKRLFVLGMTAFFLVSCGGGQAGKVTEEEFNEKKSQLAEQPYTSGKGQGQVTQKQQGRVTNDSTCSYLFTYENGEWSGSVSEGSGSATQFKTLYEHTMGNYLKAVDSIKAHMENAKTTFTATEKEYSVTMTGKFDYAKAYPTVGAEGLLAETFIVKWDEYGMPTRWELKMSGKLKYAGQSISYEEYTLITATWIK